MGYIELRESLIAAGEEFRARFEAGESVVTLVHDRAALIDDVLTELWQAHLEPVGAALVADGKVYRQDLAPGKNPEATFCIEASEATARAYCNLHGLWKS